MGILHAFFSPGWVRDIASFVSVFAFVAMIWIVVGLLSGMGGGNV